MLSSPLTAVADKIKQKQPGAVDTSTLKEFKIGESRVVFVVHPTNPVKKGCVDLQAVRQSPLPRLRAFDNCENEGVYQRRLAYAGFACRTYHLAAYITLPHQLGDRE